MKFYFLAFWLFLLLLLVSATAAFAQTELIAISGEVREKGTNESLPGVSISVKGATMGTQTDASGRFELQTKLQYPFVLVFYAIGPTELNNANMNLTPGAAFALYGINTINGMAKLITKSPSPTGA